MLSVPLKKTKQASVKGALVAHLKKGGDYNPEFDAVFNNLDTLRAQAMAPDAKINAVKSYVAQLLHLGGKFPVDGGEPEITLGYNWSNAFNNNTKIDGKFALEKAASLFNLAALHTHEGAKLVDPAAMKPCCAHWGNAAGIFKFIRVSLVPQLGGSGGSDLTPGCLQALENVCYAAVQAAVFHRASANGMKAQNLASISAGVVTVLERAYEAMQSDSEVRDLLSMQQLTSAAVGKMLPLQLQYFRIVSHVHQAEVKRLEAEETAMGYGHYVSRLRLTNSLIGSLKSKVPRNARASALAEKVAELAKTVAEKLKLAEEENRLLYVEVVPASNALSEIKPHMMKMADEARADAFDPTAFAASAGASIFGSMSPELMKLKKMISAKVEELKGIGSVRASRDADVTAALNGGGDAAATAAGGGAPTPELWAKVAEFQAKGLKGLKDEIENVTKIRQSLLEKIEALEKQLAEEAAADDAQRASHGAAWKVPPSSEAAKHVKANLEQFRKQVGQAASGDAHTVKTLETNTALLQWLCTPKAQLEAEASAPAPEAASAPNPQKYLDASLAKLTESKAQSAALFEQLVDALSKVDIEAGVAALPEDKATTDFAGSVSTVLAQPLQLHSQLTQVLEQQTGMCTSVNGLRASVNKFKANASSGASQKLAELCKKLQDGVARGAEISNFIGQGKNYYTSLQPLADQHATAVGTFLSCRRAAATAETQAVAQRQRDAAAEAARQKQIAESLKQAQEREARMKAEREQAQREAQARELQRQQQQRQQALLQQQQRQQQQRQQQQLQQQQLQQQQLQQQQRQQELLRQQQEAARQRALAPPVVAPLAPALMSLTVTIPPGIGPGGTFRARLPDGRECMVSVPAGMFAGSQLTINVPAAPPPAPVALPVPLPVPSPPGLQPAPPPRGVQSASFDMSIYSGPQREAITQMKNFALNSTYEQCSDYLLRHNFDVQKAVQAFYSDNPPQTP